MSYVKRDDFDLFSYKLGQTIVKLDCSSIVHGPFFPLWKHSCFIMENFWKLHLCWKCLLQQRWISSNIATFSRLLCWALFLSEGLLCFEQEALSSVTLPWPFFMPYWPWRRQWAPISSLERPLVLSFIVRTNPAPFNMTEVTEWQLCAYQWICIFSFATMAVRLLS